MIQHSKSPDDVGEHLVSGLARAVDGLLGSVPEWAAELSGLVDDLADGLGQAASAVLDGLLGGGGKAPSSPVDAPVVPPALPVPAAPPPTVPIPVGGPSLASGSLLSGSVFSGDAYEKLLKQFGILVLFGIAVLRGGERFWASRKLLTPSSLARPPNERPG